MSEEKWSRKGKWDSLDLRVMAGIGVKGVIARKCYPTNFSSEEELLAFFETETANKNSAICTPCPYTHALLRKLEKEGKLICMDSIDPDYPNAGYSFISAAARNI